MTEPKSIVVIGGGHAGIEAAAAAARMGARVTLVTLKRDSLARLSCNPAIGGIGKAHLVREIDALGGIMGLAADLAGIHFRVLNRSRGPAVQGPRVQQDLEEYPRVAARLLDGSGEIEIREGEVAGLIVSGGRCRGVLLADREALEADAVVLTTGTFLRGRMYRGEEITEGGRAGESAASRLSDSLLASGVRTGRFKTGTPPRLVAETLDFSAFEPQPGDRDPEPLSFLHLENPSFRPRLPQLTTWIAHTVESAHQVVRSGLLRSPLYTGRIESRGPRYCPSFEDKVVRFPDRQSHLLHLEPMGVDHPWVYVNGLSTSLPPDLQRRLVGRIPGLESAEIARFGYAVEYDYVPPTQLSPALELRSLPSLFLAGQICGTTGYEEAAALGLAAGINAACRVLGREPWIPQRTRSYIGVLVDDLTTRGVVEPYRMFTSRAELRLSLSPDTADRRLGPIGSELGVLPAGRAARARERWLRLDEAEARLEREGELRASRPTSPADRIRRGEDAASVVEEALAGSVALSGRDVGTLVARIRYRGYLERERREAERIRRAERAKIPPDIDYDDVAGLSHEARERLREVRPGSLGRAARIPGLTPVAIGLIAAILTRRGSA